MPSSSSSTGTLGAAMMSIAIGKGCKIIVNRIVKRMSKPKMDVSRTVVPRKKLQILINGHKPDKWSFWIYYSWRLLSMAFAVAVVFALSKDINHIIADWTSGWTVNLDFFALLDNHPWVNLLLFIWLLVGVAFYVWKNWKNKYFSLVGVGVASAVSILGLRQGVWKYATTPIGFLNYDWFVAIVAWGFIVWSLSRCLTFKHCLSDALFIESPEILYGSTAASDDHDIHAIGIERSDSFTDTWRSAFPLHNGRI